jgi:GH24 family phage-related lysozyme (muramidase)
VSRYVAGSPPLTLTGSTIEIDDFGAELTGAFENVYEAVYCPYFDPYGLVWTRGYGETDWSGDFGGRCISHAQALANLRYLMDTQYLAPVRALGVNLSHDQVDALGDLSWNVGPGDICCELASLLRAHEWYSAALYIRRYSYAGGSFLQGLYDRRVREGELLQVVEHPKPAPTHAQLETQLAGHEAELRHLERQRADIQKQLVAWLCRVKPRHSARCRGAEAAGQRVGAHGRTELAQIHRLQEALR